MRNHHSPRPWWICVVAVALSTRQILLPTQAFHLPVLPSTRQGKVVRQQQQHTSTTFGTRRHGWIPGPFASSSSVTALFSTTEATPTTTTSTNKKKFQDHLSRGDARGAAILLENVSVARGSAQILQEIDWRVEPKSKWAILGPNGCGKSTLLKAMMEELIYEGTITIGTTQTVGYLQQTAVAGSTKTIFDEAASAMQDLSQARAMLEAAETRVASAIHPSAADLEALDRATEQFERLGGYQQEQEVASMLKGLGFQNLTQRCDELSGGWQMRVSFAKTLLSKPTLCLLDEPGNHLDRNARQWLAQYLKNYQDGAMILVTHDVELLQAMDHIAEVNPGGKGLSIYKSCTYQQYLDLKQQRQESATKEYERNAEKAAKLQGFVDRFGASATKASAAQSRVKQIEKMQNQGLLEAPTTEQRFRPRLKLPNPPAAANEILLELRNAEIGYTAQEPLISNVNLEIRRGMKILIRGPNGAGKSTLLHSLRGTLPLLSGELIPNRQLELGVFTQDLAQELDPNQRAVDLVTSAVRQDFDINISDKEARSALGGLGLSGEKSLRYLRDLSGGEKARVALGIFALKPCNLYLLDEVSNHLDIECVEALSEALSEWGDERGSIVVISHDKSFCDKVGFTHVVTVDNGRLTMEQREARSTDWDASTATVQRTSTLAGDGESSSAAVKPEMDAATRKKAFNAPRRIKKIEELVEAKESKMAALDQEMITHGSDVGKLVDLTKAKNKLEKEVVELMAEWEELEALLEQIA